MGIGSPPALEGSPEQPALCPRWEKGKGVSAQGLREEQGASEGRGGRCAKKPGLCQETAEARAVREVFLEEVRFQSVFVFGGLTWQGWAFGFTGSSVGTGRRRC